MSAVKIPFKAYFKGPMLSGVKTYTSRTKAMGHPGDTFTAFGTQFVILSIQVVRLSEVSTCWLEEGCQSEEDFRRVWREIHPHVGYVDDQLVILHRFRKVES